MYTGAGAEQQMAQQVLAQFQEHPDAWQRVPVILQQSSNSQTKVRLSLCRTLTSVHCAADSR
jgi:hypothetical protein